MSLFRRNKHDLNLGGYLPGSSWLHINPSASITFHPDPTFPKAEDKPKPKKLPVEKTTVPVLAQRAVKLGAGRGGPVIRSCTDAGGNADLLKVEQAKCRARKDLMGIMMQSFTLSMNGNSYATKTESEPEHEAPAVDCECGFYAVPLGQTPREYVGNGRLMATVELGGRIIEEECPDDDVIYRAEYQHIITLHLPGCDACGSLDGGAWVPMGGSDRTATAFLCQRHCEHMSDGVLVTADDLASTGVAVVRADPEGIGRE